MIKNDRLSWRGISLAAQLLALIIMAVPGSYLWSDVEGTIHSASYLQPDPYIFAWAWIVYGLVAIMTGICLTVFLRRRSGPVLLWMLPAGGFALWFMCRVPATCAVYSIGQGSIVWLPFLPPVLLVLSVLASGIAWYLQKGIGASFRNLFMSIPPIVKDKSDRSSAAQKWKLAVLAFLLITIVAMLIPGAHIWCSYDKSVYPNILELHCENYISFRYGISPLTICLIHTLIAAVCAYIALKAKKRNYLLAVVPLIMLAFWFLNMSLVFEHAQECAGHGHGIISWLPLMPPILLVLSMLTAVIAWFVGRKEA